LEFREAVVERGGARPVTSVLPSSFERGAEVIPVGCASAIGRSFHRPRNGQAWRWRRALHDHVSVPGLKQDGATRAESEGHLPHHA
jgi:hypothetical protein